MCCLMESVKRALPGMLSWTSRVQALQHRRLDPTDARQVGKSVYLSLSVYYQSHSLTDLSSTKT
jgi:hypothetical protein